MHVLAAVVWIGGLIYTNTVLHPLVEHEGSAHLGLVKRTRKRFFPFIWFSVWTMFATGMFLMLLSPRFVWFDFSTLWSKLLLIKQACFVLLVFVSWQAARVRERLENFAGPEEEEKGWREAFQKLTRRSIALGLAALLCAAGMAVS